MPDKIAHFYEPFGGGLSSTIFLIHTGRVKASNCHVGDLHQPQVNFFKVLQAEYEQLTLALLESRLWHGNGTRELFKEAVDQINNPDSPFKQAWGLYIFNRICMMGIRKYEYGSYAKSTISLGGGLTHSAVLRVPGYGALIQGVDIQERPYTDALEAASKNNGFVFLDPPYEGFDEILYDVVFDLDDFAERCHAVRDKCSIMITINDSPANRERFRDYQLFTRDVFYGMSKKNQGELVICNYQLDAQDYYLKQLGYAVAA